MTQQRVQDALIYKLNLARNLDVDRDSSGCERNLRKLHQILTTTAMVREIVHLSIGQCGNQVGMTFWDTMCEEHHLDNIGVYDATIEDKYKDVRLDKIGVYFQEAQVTKHRYIPRSIMIDLEPGTMDNIKNSKLSKMFKQDNYIFGQSGAGNNWAKGHYTEGAELVDDCENILRKEVESCDCPQGFQITHSLGGGTGSGLGTLMLMKIRDNFPDRINVTYSVYPSPLVSDVVVEPYNAILSIHQLLENSDETFVIDNEALYKISHNVLKQEKPKYHDLNWVISLTMSGLTASLRFPGKLNGDLRKLGVNLIPFPRLHFFAIAESPLFSEKEKNHIRINVRNCVDQMWESTNFLADVHPDNGKYLAASCAFRGNVASQEVDDELSKIQQKLADEFVTWIPNNIKSSIINVPPENTPISSTFVANSTAIREVFMRIANQFDKMYKRKAFLHWYKGEGMDELEFQESIKNCYDLITEYQDKEDAVVENEDNDDNNNDDDDEAPTDNEDD